MHTHTHKANQKVKGYAWLCKGPISSRLGFCQEQVELPSSTSLLLKRETICIWVIGRPHLDYPVA